MMIDLPSEEVGEQTSQRSDSCAEVDAAGEHAVCSGDGAAVKHVGYDGEAGGSDGGLADSQAEADDQ